MTDEPPPVPPDPAQIQARFDRLGEILGDIATRADTQAATRCPYRDRHDHCTAKFRCRNQAQPEADAGDEDAVVTLTCTHDGNFDYRSAWESNPRAADRTRRRLAATRRARGAAEDTPRPED